MRTKPVEPNAEDSAREVARYTWLSTAEAGGVAGDVGDAKVREWIAAGELEALNIGTHKKPEWRIRPEALEALMAKRTKNAA